MFLTPGDFHKFSFIAISGKFIGYQPVIDLITFRHLAACNVFKQLNFKKGKCHLQIMQFGKKMLKVIIYRVRITEGQESILVGHHML